MAAKKNKSIKVEEWKSVSLVDRDDKNKPVVNKISFRDIFGVVSKFVQVGGDFV